jgi:hypothetical protein
VAEPDVAAVAVLVEDLLLGRRRRCLHRHHARGPGRRLL